MLFDFMNIDIKPKILRNILYGPSPTENPILLTHKNIYIFPSKIGLFWFFLILIMFLIGLNYRNNIVLIFCLLLFSISMLSLIYNFYQLYFLEIIPGKKGKNIFAKDIAEFYIYIREKKGIRRYLYILSDALKEKIIIEPKSTKVVKYGCITKKRGVFWAPKFTIISYFPFGLFRCWTVLRFNDSIMVYPRPRQCSMRYFNTQDNTQRKNKKLETKRGIDDLSYLDKYNPYNPSSRIYWKIYAQRDELVEKIFTHERTKTLILDLDMFKNNSLDQSLEMLTYLVLECHKKGIRYGLKLRSYEIRPSYGIEHKHKCLTALAIYPNIKTHA